MSSWYYEWKHHSLPNGKTKARRKYLIQPAGASITYLCGLYRFEDDLPVFTVLTREPSEELKEIHDRMPLILPGDMIADWINVDTNPNALLPLSLTEMVFEPVEKDR
ncbi:MAG: SOS response-associated peptidase [Lachnospiraceae bacterium]|nr:SOS response-associated peptidase [Lachnospiraceae bacterium]